MKKKILKSGSGPKPTEFAECEIQYIGYFTNGKVFANTFREYEVCVFLVFLLFLCLSKESQKSVTFQMKKNKVIYGWEVACMTMKKGEKVLWRNDLLVLLLINLFRSLGSRSLLLMLTGRMVFLPIFRLTRIWSLTLSW